MCAVCGQAVPVPSVRAYTHLTLFCALLSEPCLSRCVQDQLTPLDVRREILTTIGRKYDQYLDFRQQDAHEIGRAHV